MLRNNVNKFARFKIHGFRVFIFLNFFVPFQKNKGGLCSGETVANYFVLITA